MNDLDTAKNLLISGEFTCVICRGELLLTSALRGVKPLVSWYESGVDTLGAYAADKVVGRGAAFLYLLMGVRSVYARLISAPALSLLCENGVVVEYSSCVPNIINRVGDGICPFEAAVLDISEPQAAYVAIRSKMLELNISVDEVDTNAN